MQEILRDQIWQFIGACFSIIAIFVTVYFFILQKKKKTLSYCILTNTRLLTVDEAIKGELKIIYDGVVIQDVVLLVVKIFNSGNVPIISPDFEESLSFDFGQKTRILSVEIVDATPSILSPVLTINNQSELIIHPMLLNEKDGFSIKLLLTEYENCVTPKARIIGVKNINEIKKTKNKSFIQFTLMFLASISIAYQISDLLFNDLFSIVIFSFILLLIISNIINKAFLE